MLVEDGKFSHMAIVCQAKKGICFDDEKCSTCQHAEKYVYNRIVFQKLARCRYKTSVGGSFVCTMRNKPCSGTDCNLIQKQAYEIIEQLKKSE